MLVYWERTVVRSELSSVCPPHGQWPAPMGSWRVSDITVRCMIESGREPHDQGPSHINYCMTYSRRTRLVLLSEGNQYWRTIQLGLSANYWTCIGSISGYWDGSFHVLHKMSVCAKWKHVIFDCEVREIMHLVASVCPSLRPSVCPSICLFAFSPLNHLTSALTSAAKSNKSHYQFRVFVCVSVISGRMRIIAQMRSTAFNVGLLLGREVFSKIPVLNVTLFFVFNMFFIGIEL